MLFQGLILAVSVALSQQSGYQQNSGYGSAQLFQGLFKGSCDADGFYYKDGGTFMMCSNGNAYEHRCAPGTRNSDFNSYSKGFRAFCNVNLVDHGYTLKFGNKGGHQGSGYGTHNSGYGGQHSGYGTQNSGYGSRNAGYGNQHQGYGNQNSGYGNQNSGYGNQNSGYGNHNSGYGNQNSGYGSGFGFGGGSGFGGGRGGKGYSGQRYESYQRSYH